MPTLKPIDTITGSAGKAYGTINGNVEELLYAKDIEAKIEKEKSEIPIMGRKSKGNKANGVKMTGKMTIYYITSLFRQMMVDYIKTGVDTYFDLLIVNEDPSSASGKQSIMLKGVNINSVIIAKLDADVTELDEEVDFTFEDVEILEAFNKVEGEYIGG